MSFSRRRFLKASVLTALFAGVPAKSGLVALGQRLRKVDLDPTPFNPMGVAFDPLAYYTQSTFMQYINSVFRVRGSITADVKLKAVKDFLPANASQQPGRQCFMLLFGDSNVFLAQETYTVQHAALGTFKLFLVPAGTDENGPQGAVATINRLGPNDVPGSHPSGWRNPKQRRAFQPDRKSSASGVTNIHQPA